jgi:hypothetical protein
MNEQTPQAEKQPSATYLKFLEVVKNHGVKATILVSADGSEKKKFEYWNLKRGATDLTPVTEDNLVDYRALTRKERRAVFVIPYKYGRRTAVNKNRKSNV